MRHIIVSLSVFADSVEFDVITVSWQMVQRSPTSGNRDNRLRLPAAHNITSSQREPVSLRGHGDTAVTLTSSQQGLSNRA